MSRGGDSPPPTHTTNRMVSWQLWHLMAAENWHQIHLNIGKATGAEVALYKQTTKSLPQDDEFVCFKQELTNY